MPEVLFIQGAGENVHDDWDRALVDSLEHELGPDHHMHYPRMPDEADPHYATWKPALLRELEAIGDGAILVGHSIGGTMLLHALAERPGIEPRVLALIAAPFIGRGGWPSDELAPDIDFAQRLPAMTSVVLYHGTDDDTVPTAHVHLYARALPHAIVHVLAGRDHQLDNDLREIARNLRSPPP